MRIPWLLLPVCACRGDADGPRSPAEPTDPPAPYLVDEASSPVATASLEQIADALQEAVDEALLIHAAPVRASYDAAMALAEPTCPYFYEDENGRYWYDDCTTADGTSFTGYVFSEYETGISDGYSDYLYDYWYASGGASVVDAGGRTLEVAGLAYHYEATGPEGDKQFYAATQGGFSWDGPEADGSWMQLGLDPDLEYTAIWLPVVDGHYVVVDGGFGGFGRDGGWAASFDDVLLYDRALGSPCQDEPHGTVSVRAPDGTWYDVAFHGPDDTGVMPEGGTCDGCGEAWFLGEPIGEVCADFGALLGWGESPW